MSLTSNQESSLYENSIFPGYGSFLIDDKFQIFQDLNDITGNSYDHQNKANNFQDEQLDNHPKLPNENSSNSKKEIKPEQIKSNDAIFLSRKTKTGRIPKNSTDIGQHTSASEDNKYDKDFRSFFNYLINSLNDYI